MASGELVHVGPNLVGHGLGEGARKARKIGGAYRIRGPKESRPRPQVHVQVPVTTVAQAVGAAELGGITALTVNHSRKKANRKGATIKPLDPYLHPLQTAAQQRAVNKSAFGVEHGPTPCRG